MISSALRLIGVCGIALALFGLGRLAGGAFSKPEKGATPDGPHRTPVSAVPSRKIDHRGGSVFLAERDGYPAGTQRLLSLEGRAGFAAALVELTPEELKHLFEELCARTLTPKARRVLMAVAARWVEIDPRAAFESTLGNERTTLAERQLRRMAIRHLAATDPEEALRLAALIEDSRESAFASGEVFEVFAQKDPARAAEFLLQRDTFGNEAYADGRLATWLVRNWAASDPASAAAFVAQLPPAMRAQPAEELARIWAKSDAPAAYRWISAREGVGRDQKKRMLESFVTTASTSDPDFVIGLINSEEGYPVREFAMGKLAEHYARAQPDTAVEWIGTLADFEDQARAARGAIIALPPGGHRAPRHPARQRSPRGEAPHTRTFHLPLGRPST